MTRLLLTTLLAASTFAQSGVFTNSADVGNPARKGSTQFDASTEQYRITGSGANIWGKQDQFQFAWREMSGNFSVTATMHFLGQGAEHRKAGIMLRQSLDADSSYGDFVIHGSGMPGLQWRSSRGENTNAFDFPFDGPGKFKLKLVRNGVGLTAFLAREGAELKQLARTEVSFRGPILVGLAVCAHQADASDTVVFSDVSIEPLVPDWALPGSPTHKQVPPPADFHRPSRNFNVPIGLFEGQSDVGAAVVLGSAVYNAGAYTINSAGYNIWYSRDEFRYLWKKMSGDISLAADVAFPNPEGYADRKAVLVIRQNLDDDSKEAMIGQHGAGMLHLAERTGQGANIQDMQYRFGGMLAKVSAKRIGLEKHGETISIFISLQGEPMQRLGPPITLHFDEPFYVGIGFSSHLPDKSDTAVLSNVVLENAAGKVH